MLNLRGELAGQTDYCEVVLWETNDEIFSRKDLLIGIRVFLRR